MREIKHRGLNSNGEWVYGCYVNGGNTISGVSEHTIVKYGCYACEVGGESVGQYTGLKDKNGVEIYEGDVVICYPDEIEFCYFKVVEWDNEKHELGITTNGRSGAALCDGNQNILLVAGNIHQNPELIK